MAETTKKIPCQCVYRALVLLENLAAHPSARLTDLANETDLNKATAYRLLTTMQARGFVEQSKETQEYRLGSRPGELATLFAEALAQAAEEDGNPRSPEEIDPRVILEGSSCADDCGAEDCR